MTIFDRAGAFYGRRRAAVIVGGIGAFCLVVNLVWLARDTLPPPGTRPPTPIIASPISGFSGRRRRFR